MPRCRLRLRTPGSRRRAPSLRGFTLVEVMLVVGIMGIIAAMGAPSILAMFRKEALRQGVSDLVEGLSHARAQAILQGQPCEFVLRAEDRRLLVPATGPAPASTANARERLSSASAELAAGQASPVFDRALSDDVHISFLDVNLVDQMDADQARVRFFPNGTSDDFTVVLEHASGVRKISLDPVTGLADVESIR